MKKIFVLFAALVAFGFAANAQNAIGLRFGGGNGYGAELSFQKGLGANRLELDLGLAMLDDNYFNLTGVYQWVNNLSGDLNWYAGVGANVGYCNGTAKHGLGLALAGQIGIEYNIPSIPFQVSLDARPQYEFLLPQDCSRHGFGWGACLSVRYTF